MEVKLVPAHSIFELRNRVLRPGQALSASQYPEDNSPTTFHIGAFIGAEIVCCATFLVENHSAFESRLSYRLRGMATDVNFQKQGIGKLVLDFGIDEIKSRGGDLLWCNARQTAFGFYEKFGLKVHGPLFDILGAGPHKVMYKYL